MLKDNIAIVLERIAGACKKKGIEPGSVTLVAVTKTVDAESVREAISLGIKDIGESRVQEAQSKFEQLSDTLSVITKHMIGHLQSNKAKKAVELFDLIQSVDTLELAGEINNASLQKGKVQDVLLEIKVSDEATKFGLSPEEAKNFMADAEVLRNIRVRGLMAMAPYFEDPAKARPYFRKAREIFDGIRSVNKYAYFGVLSMGMSNDFEVAVEEGATMVRVGSAIFK